MPTRIDDPEQLKALLGIPFTPEQLACVTAPPAPQVIVAGAGSGKTTVMAARVVWLVGTGQVPPEGVLGLTFTNKAAGELAERVRRALAAAGVTDPDPAPTTAGGESDQVPGEPRISTYHAFAGRLLTDHGLRMGVEPSARLLADATRYQLAARVLRTAPGPYPALTRSLPALVEDLLALDAELAEHLVDPADLLAHDTALLAALDGARLSNADLRKVPEAARARRELVDLVIRYRAEKRRRDLLDFGDQIAMSATLATGHAEVGRMLREEFPVVLLDEYQDTSVAQRLLLSGLFGAGGPGGGQDAGRRPADRHPAGSGPPGLGHAVTAVGDPCQAIYGWRGASVANLDDFPRHFPHADGTPATRHSLSENRRSGGRLLDLANRLAAPLRALHEGVEALRPAPGAERDGVVRCALLTTHAEELHWLADSVAHLVRTGTPPGEIAVLCRTAGDFAALQGALVAREVPVEVVGLSGLLHLPEVADLVAMCEVLQDPTANAALVRLLVGPRWRIGPRDLALLGRRARLLVRPVPPPAAAEEDAADLRLAEAVEGVDPSEVVSLADAMDTFLDTGGDHEDDLPFSAEARVRFAHFAGELRDLRRSLSDPLMDVLHRVLATTGLDVELAASPHALAARRRETLGNFLDIAAGFASLDGDAGLLAFLGFLRTANQYEKGLDGSLPGGENTVKVLTAHKSKGLEWDVVAVPGLVDKQFPSEQSREAWTSQAKVLPHALRGDAATLPDVEEWDSKGLTAFKERMKDHQRTEELRLGYVTFTRPRSLLLASGHRWGPHQKRPRGPSVFLEELRRHCEAGHGEVEAWAEAPEDGAENPALTAAAEEQPWPLPLDPEATARRREAAATVQRHLDTLLASEAGRDRTTPDPATTSPPTPTAVPATPGEDPYGDAFEDLGEAPHEDPYEVPDEDGRPDAAGEDLGDWDSWSTGRPGEATEGRPDTPPGPRVPAARAATPPGSTPTTPLGEAASDDAPADDAPADVTAPDVIADDVTAPDVIADDVAAADVIADDVTAADGTADGVAAADVAAGCTTTEDEGAPGTLLPEERRTVAAWDRDLEALVGELHRSRVTDHEVPLPHTLSASQLLRLAADPDGFAAELARPMPRPPQPAARRGTRFHAWVESRFEELPLPMLGYEELPGADLYDLSGLSDLGEEAVSADPDGPAVLGGGSAAAGEDGAGGADALLGPAGRAAAEERELDELKAAFERTDYARRTPHRVEAPFQITLAGRVVRGRIDAVYRTTGPNGERFEIVDWKTHRAPNADPLQLAVYRLAWAEQHGLDPEEVMASFVYVRSGEVVRPARLPGRPELERLLTG
ncbi:UvrD-helicase domain-containing protein [Streptomyces sp. NPDC059740]|uniref:UvrD-helicase domain-containing protein n=1 Tax=Streptomyces sp. NPDC059740 TaxID=3346926 RepID=UPI00365FC159